MAKKIKGLDLNVCAAARRELRLASGADLRSRVAGSSKNTKDAKKDRRSWKKQLDY